MRSRKTIRTLWKRGEDRGAIGVILALAMTVLLGSAALAIDLGHLMNVRTESQRVADLAALAGASAFIDAQQGAALTTVIDARAKQYAASNEVNQSSVVLTSSDIQVDIPNERVRVTVYHTQARGSAVQTVFARILGINTVDVVTTAVAQAYPAGGATCILPFMLPDRYLEAGGDPELYDLAPPDYYEPYDPANFSPTATGYTESNIGDLLIIKGVPGNANTSRPNPSWYYPIRAYAPGGNAYRQAIAGCVDASTVYAIGDLVDVQPGAIPGPTRQGFDALIAQAPTHAWHTANKCVVDTAAPDPNLCIGGSARLRPVPMMAPPDAPPPGASVPVPIMNWASVFVESRQGDEVYVRFAGYSGVLAIDDPNADLTGLPKVIRLVE